MCKYSETKTTKMRIAIPTLSNQSDVSSESTSERDERSRGIKIIITN